MELKAVPALDTRRIAVLDVFAALAALAVLASLFLPWFVAEYQPHPESALVCFDSAVPNAGGFCEQAWSGWQTISIHWIVPAAAFVAVPAAARRIWGDRHRPNSVEWLSLTGSVLAVVALGFFLTPDLGALNEAQVAQAELYAAEPWVYTTVTYSSGLFSALGFALASFVTAALRVREDPDHQVPGLGSAALLAIAVVAAIFPISWLGEVVTRF